MPSNLTFADRFGHRIPDTLADIDERSTDASSTDSDFQPDSDYDSDHDSNSDYDSATDTDSDNDDNDPDNADNVVSSTWSSTFFSPPSITGLNVMSDPLPKNDQPMDDVSHNTSVDEHHESDHDSFADNTSTTGVDRTTITGVDDTEMVDNTGDADTDANDPMTDTDANDPMTDNYGPRSHNFNLRPRKPRSYDYRYSHQMYVTYDKPFGLLFMTEQMSLKRGLKHFGTKGADAVIAELRQLHYRQAIEPKMPATLTAEERKRALRYLMYLKQKRCGRIKARGCADGRKQRLYKTKHETSSPTVSSEAVFLTSIIDAQENRTVVTMDIPGAFLHAYMDETVHMRLDGPMAELLVRVDPIKYGPFLQKEGQNMVLYVLLNKALYGTLQAALLFWQNLTTFLIHELGFTLNKYDKCVANKMINGQQCTIIWHVDDLKVSHRDPNVVEEIIKSISDKYGKEDPVTVNRGKVHEYLGMKIDFTHPGQVKFTMEEYINNVLNDVPESMSGTAATPAANHLFEINPNTEKLNSSDSELFHHITAQLLYLCKRSRPDIQTSIAFLCTRVAQPDTDDWKKLSRCIRYLRGTKDLALTLEANDDGIIRWWIDASFAVHRDMKSHTGLTMTLGKGCPISSSTRQKINTKSSTEAELVGVDDGMGLITWTRNFLQEQQFTVNKNIVYQDNQSAILLERNGRNSSGRRTRHIDIRYFFIADRIRNGELQVEYCPTNDMVADFFTKPLQGSVFKKLRAIVMNLPDDVPLPMTTSGPQECVNGPSWAEVVSKKWSVRHQDVTSMNQQPQPQDPMVTLQRKLAK
jgi:hypothetical protein